MSLIDSIAKKNKQQEIPGVTKAGVSKRESPNRPQVTPLKPCPCGEYTWWQSVYSEQWLCGTCNPPPSASVMRRFVNVAEISHLEIERQGCQLRILSEQDPQWHESYWSVKDTVWPQVRQDGSRVRRKR
jgi:hypothetical protein